MKRPLKFLQLLIIVTIGLVATVTPGADGGVYDGAANFFCYFREECCREPAIRNAAAAIEELNKTMTAKLFGQHIAKETVLIATEAHLNDPSPDKPLIFSFHGWPGSGKTYLAQMILDSIFVKGQESAYIKYFAASSDFPDHKLTSLYKAKLKSAIETTLAACDRSVFIFDEVDRMPPNLLDSLSVFLDRFNAMEGVNQKKAIYIFLSNVGAAEINKKSLEQWKKGRRTELTFLDFEKELSMEAFKSQDNGLSKSFLIQRHLIGHYVPFLPMERQHVIQCITAELKSKNIQIRKADLETIADTVDYWPDDLKVYSMSGCRQVQDRVRIFTRRKELKRSVDEL